MSEYQTINFSRAEGLATITLNRPDDANGLNPVMASELRQAAKACEEDQSIKVVVLTGSGRFFCAGGDVKAMADAGQGAGLVIKNMADDLHGAVSTLARMKAPLITAINGTAAGAGPRTYGAGMRISTTSWVAPMCLNEVVKRCCCD